MGDRRYIEPEQREQPFGVWTPAIAVSGGEFLFVSGITSRDAQGRVVGEGDIEAQTRQVCENMRTTVEAAGGTLADVVTVTVFVTDIEQFDPIHEVRREYWPKRAPTSTMVEVSRFVDARSMIEMNAIAVIGD